LTGRWKGKESEEGKESKERHQKQGKERKGNRKDVIKYSWDLTIRLEIVSIQSDLWLCRGRSGKRKRVGREVRLDIMGFKKDRFATRR
jgi:hypothetical protein